MPSIPIIDTVFPLNVRLRTDESVYVVEELCDGMITWSLGFASFEDALSTYRTCIEGLARQWNSMSHEETNT